MNESLMNKLNEAIKHAMKAGNKSSLEGIRTLKGSLQKLMIDKGAAFSPDDEMNFLLAESKRRKEAIELYQKGGRNDLADKEQQELQMINAYLPEQMDDKALGEVIETAVKETGAQSAKDVGKVMGLVMGRVKGMADGKRVQQLVKSKLGA